MQSSIYSTHLSKTETNTDLSSFGNILTVEPIGVNEYSTLKAIEKGLINR